MSSSRGQPHSQPDNDFEDVEIGIRFLIHRKCARQSSPGASTPDGQTQREATGVNDVSSDMDLNVVQPPRQRACERIQKDLLKAREELVEVRSQLLNLTAKWMQCEVDLCRERELNQIAQEFIPEDQMGEYLLACPCRQPIWEDYRDSIS